MKKDMNTLLLTMASILFSGTMTAQESVLKVVSCETEKTSCDLTSIKTQCIPVSCGPEGTKTGEANVVTILRNDLAGLKGMMGKIKQFSFDTSLLTKPISVGKDDDESIALLKEEMEKVGQELSTKAGIAALSVDKKKPTNKAQLVSQIREQLNYYRSHLRKL